mmetsp:Transcript_3652/g.6695  ORF Transcript_3652/g.6695 Transcript_3652/m.6695 type:complete len:317 (-) Transcript_3652:144-1094(-)
MVQIKKNRKFFDFDAIEGRKSLTDTIMNEMKPEDTSLVLNIGDADPDDSYSTVAYEKGFTFLLYLERLVGTPEFESFFKAYIATFSGETLTSEDFRDFFIQHFQGNKKVNEIEWDVWLYGRGMPPVLPPLDQSMAKASKDLASLWVAVDREGKAPPTKNDMTSWSSPQITCFLDALHVATEDKPLQISTLQAMDNLYHLAESQNSEILFRYCQLAVASEDSSILPVALRFITSQGRMKFVRPLYRSLYKSRFGRKMAVETFLKNKDFYHPIATKMIAMDLKVSGSGPSILTTNPWVLTGVAVAVVGVSIAFLRGRK